MGRTGFANMPLHGGRAPSWLFSRMRLLAREISLAIVTEFGPDEMLRKLSDPHWFQAFGCVLGFDWHSSGVTTTVCGALKEGLRGLEREAGFFVAGGKGGTSRKTPDQILAQEGFLSIDPNTLVYASRMSAKVDNTALQDGYQLYHHVFISTSRGDWCVIQQGMNEHTGRARRYHWLGKGVKDFVDEPHAAICCNNTGEVLNMTAHESDASRRASALVSTEHPDMLIRELQRGTRLDLPDRHYITRDDINIKWLKRTLASTYETRPSNFEALLAVKGVGPKAVRSLVLIAELIYGAKPSFRDPAQYSFAHGGKDGIPYPVDRKTYDRSTEIMRKAVESARIGRREKLEAIRNLGRFYAM